MCAVPGPTFWTHQNSKNALEVLLLFQWISSKVGWFSLRLDVFCNHIATEINYCHEGFCLFLHHPVLYGRSLYGKNMEIAMEEIDRSSWPSWRFAWFAVGLGDVFQNDKTPKSSHSLSSPKYHARQRKTPSGICMHTMAALSFASGLESTIPCFSYSWWNCASSSKKWINRTAFGYHRIIDHLVWPEYCHCAEHAWNILRVWISHLLNVADHLIRILTMLATASLNLCCVCARDFAEYASDIKRSQDDHKLHGHPMGNVLAWQAQSEAYGGFKVGFATPDAWYGATCRNLIAFHNAEVLAMSDSLWVHPAEVESGDLRALRNFKACTPVCKHRLHEQAAREEKPKLVWQCKGLRRYWYMFLWMLLQILPNRNGFQTHEHSTIQQPRFAHIEISWKFQGQTPAELADAGGASSWKLQYLNTPMFCECHLDEDNRIP